MGYARNYFLAINGHHLEDIVHGGYAVYEIEPGKLLLVSGLADSWKNHMVDIAAAVSVIGLAAAAANEASLASSGAASLELTAAAGQSYFVKLHPESTFTTFIPHLYNMPSEQAQAEIKECNRVTHEESE